MRTGVFVEERVESAARRLWKRSEAVGPPFGAGRVLSEPGLSGKGPGGGLWGHYLRQRADICSSVLPLVSGTIFQTKRADRSDMKAKMQ